MNKLKVTNYIIKIIPKESENEEFKSEEYVFRRFKENFKNFKIFINKFNEKYYHNKELMKNTIMHIIKEIRLFYELFNDVPYMAYYLNDKYEIYKYI